jgi:hypothetical protein
MLQAISYHRIGKAFEVSCPILYEREWRAELEDIAGSFTRNRKVPQLNRSAKTWFHNKIKATENIKTN